MVPLLGAGHVCLHSGVFTRAQYCHRFDVTRWSAGRFVRRLVEEGLVLQGWQAEDNAWLTQAVARRPGASRDRAP